MLRLLHLMNREDARVVAAVKAQLPQIARAVALVAHALRHRARLFFIGAGTSGRLGVLEAAECPPTFHIEPSRVQAIIAGGRRAVFRSQEGAEDARADARTIVRQRIRPGDLVVGIAASGVTPFVKEALNTARAFRAKTVLITCNPRAKISATISIALAVGPEVLTGSTRLKAGTATKLVLNMLTLGAMVQLGKTYGDLMVDVRPTSRKLRARALRIIQTIAHCDVRTAARALAAARGQTKVAVLIAKHSLPYRTALHQLAHANGSLRLALENHMP